MAATLQELRVSDPLPTSLSSGKDSKVPKDPKQSVHDNSLSTLSSRPPNLRLGMGLPLSRVYAEYWAGSLELHSLEGYGVDAFLQISKLGNKNEQLTMRASMDAV
jgi:pyruvate dehydrogenase kinase 2/3/4